MFLPLYAILVAGVITGSFATFLGMGLNFGTSLLMIFLGLAGAIAINYLVNLLLLKSLNSKFKATDPSLNEEGQRRKIRWVNRKGFWSTILTRLIFLTVVYFVMLGIPYLLFDLTLGDIKSYLLETQAGQMMMIQLGSILPIWFILPFIYFFAFYGPFVLKVLLFDMKVTEPGSAKFNVRRSDILGQDEVIDELEGMVQSVVDREKLREVGRKPDRGVLLVGPPGTGKTHTLKYLASAFGFALVQVQSTIARQTFIGVSVIAMWIVQWIATRLSRKYGGAVVLIDEIDVIAQSRSEVVTRAAPSWASRLISHIPAFGGADDSATVVLMTWMDGIDTTSPFWYRILRSRVNTLLDATFVDEFLFVPVWNILIALPVNFALRIARISSGTRLPYLREPPRIPAWQVSGDDGIFFIGTTNRPQIIDPAMMRQGRFSPVLLYYDLPDEEGRLAYINYLLRKTNHEQEIDLPENRLMIARLTEGLAQANILFVTETAWKRKRNLLRKEDRFTSDAEIKIDLEDIREARDMLVHGIAKYPRSSRIEEMRKVSIHEAGHFAITKKVSGETVIPSHLSAKRRGRSYGRAEVLPATPVDIRPRRFFEERLRVSLVSHATENRIFGENTTGVTGDLGAATLIAVQMTEFWGMGPRECTKKEREQYQKIGRKLVSWKYATNIATSNHIEYSPWVRGKFGDDAFLNPQFGETLINAIPNSRKQDIEVLLGQAYVYCDLFVRKNKEVILAVAKRLEDAGWELGGEKLQSLYQELGEEGPLKLQKVLPPSTKEDWPNLETKDLFYDKEDEKKQGGES